MSVCIPPHPVALSSIFWPHAPQLSCTKVVITLRAIPRRSPLRAALEHFVAHSDLVNRLNGDPKRTPTLFSLFPDQPYAVPHATRHPAGPCTPTQCLHNDHPAGHLILRAPILLAACPLSYTRSGRIATHDARRFSPPRSRRSFLTYEWCAISYSPRPRRA